MRTLSAPAFSNLVKTPVDSTAYSAPASAHLVLTQWLLGDGDGLSIDGSFPFSALTVPLNLPRVNSYWNM